MPSDPDKTYYNYCIKSYWPLIEYHVSVLTVCMLSPNFLEAVFFVAIAKCSLLVDGILFQAQRNIQKCFKSNYRPLCKFYPPFCQNIEMKGFS